MNLAVVSLALVHELNLLHVGYPINVRECPCGFTLVDARDVDSGQLTPTSYIADDQDAQGQLPEQNRTGNKRNVFRFPCKQR